MKRQKQKVHGAWFRTHLPESSGAGSVGNAGATGLGDAVVLLFLGVVWAAVYWSAVLLFRKKSDPSKWTAYRGSTFCRLEGTNISFWTTVRENSRLLRPTPIFDYDLPSLSRFNVFSSTPPKVVFGFSDGQTVELYFDDDDVKLDAIRSAVNKRRDLEKTGSPPCG